MVDLHGIEKIRSLPAELETILFNELPPAEQFYYLLVMYGHHRPGERTYQLILDNNPVKLTGFVVTFMNGEQGFNCKLEEDYMRIAIILANDEKL